MHLYGYKYLGHNANFIVNFGSKCLQHLHSQKWAVLTNRFIVIFSSNSFCIYIPAIKQHLLINSQRSSTVILHVHYHFRSGNSTGCHSLHSPPLLLGQLHRLSQFAFATTFTLATATAVTNSFCIYISASKQHLLIKTIAIFHICMTACKPILSTVIFGSKSLWQSSIWQQVTSI